MKGKLTRSVVLLGIFLLVALCGVSAVFFGGDLITGAIVGLFGDGPLPTNFYMTENFNGVTINGNFSNSTNGLSVSLADGKFVIVGASPGETRSGTLKLDKNFENLGQFTNSLFLNMTNSSVIGVNTELRSGIYFVNASDNQQTFASCFMAEMNNTDKLLVINNGSMFNTPFFIANNNEPLNGTLSFFYTGVSLGCNFIHANGTNIIASSLMNFNSSGKTGTFLYRTEFGFGADPSPAPSGNIWSGFDNYVVNITYTEVGPPGPPGPAAMLEPFNHTFDGTVIDTGVFTDAGQAANGMIIWQNNVLNIGGLSTAANSGQMSTIGQANLSNSFNLTFDLNFTGYGSSEFMAATYVMGATRGCKVIYNSPNNYTLRAQNISGAQSELIIGPNNVGQFSYVYDATAFLTKCSFGGQQVQIEEANISNNNIFIQTGTIAPGISVNTTIDNLGYTLTLASAPAPSPLSAFNSTFTSTSIDTGIWATTGETKKGLSVSQNDQLIFGGTATGNGAYAIMRTSQQFDLTSDFNLSVIVNFTGTTSAGVDYDIGVLSGVEAMGCEIQLNAAGVYKLVADNSSGATNKTVITQQENQLVLIGMFLKKCLLVNLQVKV